MKTIGLLGGMSWHSSALYYRLLNEGIQQRLGGLHSAKILMSSFDFEEIAALQRKNAWHEAGEVLAQQALKLQQAGADFLLIATNTMHMSVPIIRQYIRIPILHIAAATAKVIINQNYHSAGLLGTRFTMQMDYYKQHLEDQGIEVLIPDDEGCAYVDNVIFSELCHGKIKPSSRRDYLQIIDDLVDKGAECIIAGCTEITLLVKQKHTQIPLLDTTAIHAQAAVDFALADDQTIQWYKKAPE
jgi:aspartate racemase